MSKRSFIATVVLLCFTTATISIVSNDAAMSDPILIDPSSQYYGQAAYTGESGYAYDFCYQQNTLGYIVVSRQAAARLERWYAVDNTCTPPVSANTLQSNSGNSSQTFTSPIYSSSYSGVSTKRSNQCPTPQSRKRNGDLCGDTATGRRRNKR